MSNLRDAAQQALEAMHSFEWSKNGLYAGEFETEIAALRKALAEEALQRLTDVNQEIEAALAEPAQEPVACSNTFGCRCPKHFTAEPVQEPVAWMVYTLDGKSVCVTDNPSDFTEQHKALPLYTAPPQRKENT